MGFYFLPLKWSYLIPLSIWDVLLTLASQRKMELDFAAITARMSPSLSQSIPTQRLSEKEEKGSY